MKQFILCYHLESDRSLVYRQIFDYNKQASFSINKQIEIDNFENANYDNENYIQRLFMKLVNNKIKNKRISLIN